MSDVGDEVAQALLRLAETSIRLSINSVKHQDGQVVAGQNDKEIVQYDFKNEEVRDQVLTKLKEKNLEVVPTNEGAGIVFYKKDLAQVAQAAMDCANEVKEQTQAEHAQAPAKAVQKKTAEKQAEKEKSSSPRLDEKIKEAKSATKHAQKDKGSIKKEMQRNLATPSR
ncbi:hypothetical protein [Adlercreutzia agrestimuris]|uniref:hypothetical protein n=1 Tax=Adlercreutzia agrestimuris TaxID=2941324 RepID=UPI002040E9F6|nr:hypothetical protein [Adlercreutzia agrestimuris]